MAKSKEDFYSRLRELSNINKSVNEELTMGTLINFEKSNDGISYGVVKENHHYIIKKSITEGNSLHAADFTYISGVQNKNEYNYKTIAEAEKQRNLMIMSLNEAFDLGGVYTKKNKTKSPSLEAGGDVNNFLHNVIKSAKSNIRENNETKFKDTLKENNEKNKSSNGLMPDVALNAVQKALGKVNEAEDIVTADSEIKDGDIVADKSGKEESQAPITDKNAKSKADAATGTGTKDFNKKDGDSKSLVVNQADKKLVEGEDLVTADSELDANASVANASGGKESPQAPINDENAKSEAEKNNASGGSSEAISNNVEESPESEPFDDKENAGDETGDIVTGEKNITEAKDLSTADSEINTKDSLVNKATAPNTDAESQITKDSDMKPDDSVANDTITKLPNPVYEGKDISTEDSDQADGDRVDNKSEKEMPEAPINSYNQPEKGQKEEKGEKLKDTAKEVVIGEGEDLITADSEIDAASSPVNKTQTNLPNPVAEGSSIITDDSEINAEQSLANDTKTNLPNPVAEGEEEEVDVDAIAEGIEDMLDTLDTETEKDKQEAPAPEAPVDAPMGDDLGGEELGLDIPSEEGGEAPVDAPMGDDLGSEEMPDLGGEAPADGGEEMPELDGEMAAEGGEGDANTEISKLIGQIGDVLNDPETNLDAEQTKQHVGTFLGHEKAGISGLEVEDKKGFSDDIMKASSSEEGGEEFSTPEESGENGLEPDADAAIDAEMAGMEEDAPMQVDGEDFVDPKDAENGEAPCAECGTFESFVESRGYSPEEFNECSVSEAASIISGFWNGTNNGSNDGAYKSVSPFVNDEVRSELHEYGHTSHLENIGEAPTDAKFGAVNADVSIPDVFAEDGEEFGGEEVPAEVDSEIEVGGEEDMPLDVGAEIAGEEPMGFAADADVMGGEEAPIEAPVDAEVPVDVEVPEEPMGFATDTDVMGGGVVKPESAPMKSIEIDVAAGKVNVNMSESEVKLRSYIKNKLEELSGKRKPSINESKKTPTLKKLDEMIKRQYNLYGEQVKKSI